MIRVFVYYNLHKKCWSIKALEGPCKGRVIAHRDNLKLFEPMGKVSEAGRQRVIKERRKNVHAGLVGYMNLLANSVPNIEGFDAITYNPYKYSSFVYKDTEKEFNTANLAILLDKQVFVKNF